VTGSEDKTCQSFTSHSRVDVFHQIIHQRSGYVRVWRNHQNSSGGNHQLPAHARQYGTVQNSCRNRSCTAVKGKG
jgi:hypothetical protein